MARLFGCAQPAGAPAAILKGLRMGLFTGKTVIVTGGGKATLKDGSAGSIGYGIDIAFAKEYLGLNDEEGFNRGIIRGGMSSVAKLFVAQMQDYLELGAGHRTNEPGTQSGNWQWRMLSGELTPELAQRIRKLTRIYGRLA